MREKARVCLRGSVGVHDQEKKVRRKKGKEKQRDRERRWGENKELLLMK